MSNGQWLMSNEKNLFVIEKTFTFVIVKALCRKYLLAAIGYARRHKIRVGIGIILLLWYSLCLPRELFPQGYATIVESSDGKLLGGKIAPDGQWRFPELDSGPPQA